MFSLGNFEKWCKYSSEGFSKFDCELMLLSYLLTGLFYDLHLETAMRISSSILLVIFVWWFCTLVCNIVLYCIKKHRAKKTNIEKLIDEEIEKD